MTAKDFIVRFLGLIPEKDHNVETVRLLANVVDTTKDGSVNNRIAQYVALMRKPEAEKVWLVRDFCNLSLLLNEYAIVNSFLHLSLS
jgi:hypothetical protein